jgi:ATP-dependent RNA helicase DDX51/DBP6
VIKKDNNYYYDDADDVGETILPSTLRQMFRVCEELHEKPLMLLHLLRQPSLGQTLVFTKSIEHAVRLHTIIRQFITQHPIFFSQYQQKGGADTPQIAYFASTLSLSARRSLIQQFNQRHVRVLICTDALARGMDFDVDEGVKTVINYDPPQYIRTYIHRSGRTARAGRHGCVMTLLAQEEVRGWQKIMRRYGLDTGMERDGGEEGGSEWVGLVEAYEATLASLRREE